MVFPFMHMGTPAHLLCAVPVLAWVAGCANTRFCETYHVGIVDCKTNAMQFFRFEVEGRPGFLSRTKFESGWYDADALAILVGERGITQPSSKKTKPKKTDDDKNPKSKPAPPPLPATTPGTGGSAGPQATAKPKGQRSGTSCERERYVYYTTGPEGAFLPATDKRFAIIMTSDPTLILDAIKKLTESEEIKKALEEAKEKKEDRDEEKKEARCKALKSTKAALLLDPRSAVLYGALMATEGCKEEPPEPGVGEGDEK